MLIWIFGQLMTLVTLLMVELPLNIYKTASLNDFATARDTIIILQNTICIYIIYTTHECKREITHTCHVPHTNKHTNIQTHVVYISG